MKKLHNFIGQYKSRNEYFGGDQSTYFKIRN